MARQSKPPRDTSEWIDVRGDGGVLKRIMREGNTAAGVAGAHPGMCAKVNYDAYIEGSWLDGRQVETSRDRPEEDGDYQFLIGDEHEAVKGGWVIKGLNAGVETMHRGEMAELIIKPEYAYGAKGSTRPKVPPNTTLRYEVELLTWKPALSEEANMLDMTWEDRLELAYATKASATEHFREGQPEEARMRYWKAGMLMDVIGNPGTPIEMPKERLPEQNALAATCWLNEAMCYIKMAQQEEATGRNYKGWATKSATNPTLWRNAIESCDHALHYEPQSVKAYFRKALAYQHLHEFDSAREFFEKARKLEPCNREVRLALEACQQAHASANAADAALFQRAMRKTSGSLYSDKLEVSDHVDEVLRPNPRVWLAIAIADAPPMERVVLELWAAQLPKTAENFRKLCTGEHGVHPLTRTPMHYKGSPIHRVIDGLMIQGGDFVCHDGSGGESIYGAYFADEGFEMKHTEAGLLCMANAGRDTNRSQFYITTTPAPHLDGRHVVFGKVVGGIETVRAIEALATDDHDRPLVSVGIVDCGQLEQ